MISLEYIAGFFDVDGHVGIYKTIRKHGRSYHYQVRLTFINTDKKIIETIQEKIKNDININGNIIIDKKPNPKHREAYQLIYTNKTALKVIYLIQEFTILKKERLEIAKQLQEHKNQYNGGSYRRNKLSSQTLEIREELYQRIKVLNKRGK